MSANSDGNDNVRSCSKVEKHGDSGSDFYITLKTLSAAKAISNQMARGIHPFQGFSLARVRMSLSRSK